MAASITYPVIDVSSWVNAGVEPSGLTEHHWYRQPQVLELWLYKHVETHAGRLKGEDWSEKVSSEVAGLLDLPAATVELARRDGHPGVLSRNLVPRGWEMQPGSVLLAGTFPGYQPRSRDRAGHSAVNIKAALAGFVPPPGAMVPGGFDAYDVFTGYLAFDALIANRDRHDGNWAVMRPPSSASAQDSLCGSFDHASSLGFNLLDEERELRLLEGRVSQWATRGTAYRFEHRVGQPIPTLVEHAIDAMANAKAHVAAYWMQRIDALDIEDVARIVDAVPHLSDVTRTFIVELVRTNRGRLLDGR